MVHGGGHSQCHSVIFLILYHFLVTQTLYHTHCSQCLLNIHIFFFIILKQFDGKNEFIFHKRVKVPNRISNKIR